jgi:NAD-dependent DNA ligase
MEKEKLYKELKRLQDLYTNDEPEVSDAEFDLLKEKYEQMYGEKFNYVGSLPRFNKVQLPFFLPSIDSKIKGDKALKELTSWSNKYTKDKIISDKVDGFTFLYTWDCENKVEHGYSRGNGIEGQNLDHLLPYLNLPRDELYSYVVRGEVVLEKKVFQDYVEKNEGKTKNKLKNARNLANGFTTKLKENLDLELLSQATFCAYEIVHMTKMKNGKLKTYNLTPLEQFEYLEDFSFTLPFYTVLSKDLSPNEMLNSLHFILKERREDAPYDIDGLVIANDDTYENEMEQKHKLAYKEDTSKITTVKDIIWSASSKDGYLNPVIVIEKIEILGRDIERVTGKNAKFIMNNKIGRNAIVIVGLGGDSIPDLFSIIEGSNDEDMIYPDLDEDEYSWDENKVKFVLNNPEDYEGVDKAKMIYFLTHMKIKNLGEGTIDKLYAAGFNTLYDLLSMKANEIEGIERMGPIIAMKIVENIKEGINNVPLYRVMAASTVFGRGIAEERMKDFLLSQNINTVDELYNFSLLASNQREEKIISVKGWGDVNSKRLSDKLPKFIEWLDKHNMIKIKDVKTEVRENALKGKSVVFSGLRRSTFSDVDKRLDELGMIVKTGVSSKINYVVSDVTKGKVNEARELNIPVLSVAEFRKLIGL